jgi:hypothetical protein
MVKWLKDTWNGLVVILLGPYLPRRATVLAILIGVLVGLAWGYVIDETVFFDSDPSTLDQSWQNEWVKLLADRFAAGSNDPNVSNTVQSLLQAVDDPLGIVDTLIATPGEEANRSRLEAIRPLAEAAQLNAATAPQPSLLANIRPFLIAPLVVITLLFIIVIVWGMFIRPNLWDPLMKRLRGEKVSAEVLAMREQVAVAKQAEAAHRTDFSTTTLGKPLMQKMSTYLLGRGSYDDSFAIEDANETFYGECGAGISQSIGTGADERTTAVEVWMFDKDDIVTLTKVFASEYAFNDPALRAKLEPKGQITLAQVGATAVMESNSLRLQARIVDLEYGTGSLPPRSFFQKMTIELAAWHKSGAPAMTPTQVSVPPMPAYAPPAPPPLPTAPLPAAQPQMPIAPAQTPVVISGGQPLIIPPQPQPSYAPPPPRVEDDPFGGTGDFTPIR